MNPVAVIGRVCIDSLQMLGRLGIFISQITLNPFLKLLIILNIKLKAYDN